MLRPPTLLLSVDTKTTSGQHTNIQLIKRPFARNHGAILLPLLLLADGEINQRAVIGRLAGLQVLSVAVALIYAVNVDEEGDSWRDELVRGKVDGK